jgi:hypothetical protein
MKSKVQHRVHKSPPLHPYMLIVMCPWVFPVVSSLYMFLQMHLSLAHALYDVSLILSDFFTLKDGSLARKIQCAY